MEQIRVTRWTRQTPPTQTELTRLMSAEGLSPYAWSNGPYDNYSAHTHGYHKVIYVVQGSITFGLPDLEQTIELFPGDRLDLRSGTLHNANVGSQGVVCLEGHL
jgi:hypothetical protein